MNENSSNGIAVVGDYSSKDRDVDINDLHKGNFVEYPDRIGSTLVSELAKNLYSSVLDGIREAVSNGIDAGARTIRIEYVPQKYITIEDDGEGIQNIVDFQKMGELQKILQRDIKATDLIGMKGLGRYSYFMLGNDVWWLTNNGEVGFKIHRRLNTKYQVETMSAKRFIDHRGTKVIIRELNRLRPSFLMEMEKYLSKTFSYILTKGLVSDASGRIIVPDIILNGLKIQPVTKYDFTKDKHIFNLDRGIKVTGHLESDDKGTGSVDVFVNKVLVTTRNLWPIDQTRAFSGFVCCDKLTPTTSRDAITQNDTSEELLDRLQKLAAQKFPKKDVGKALDKRTLNNMKDTLALYMKFMKLNPLGKDPKGPAGNQEGKRKKGKICGLDKVIKPVDPNHVVIPRGPRNPLIKIDDKDRGLVPEITEVETGQAYLPIYYDSMTNKIYINKTSPLYGIIVNDALHLGPEWFRKAPHFIRVATQMNPECQEMAKRNIDELYKYQDRMLSLSIIEHKRSIIGLSEFKGFEGESF